MIKCLIVLAASMAVIGLVGCGASASKQASSEAIIQIVSDRDAALQAAYARGDLEAVADFLSEEYVYNDIAANRVTKEKMLSRRRGDHRRVIEEVEVDADAVALSETVVVLRGRSDTVAEYFGGLPRRGGGRYMSVWRLEPDGVWRVVAEQSTEVTPREYPVKARIAATDEALAPFAGVYTLDTSTPLRFELRAEGGALLATIPDQFEDMVFYPEGERAFFAVGRPFELVFEPDGERITLTTWGTPVAGRRAAE